MGQDLAHKRPWLLASLLAGISYPATWLLLPFDGNLFSIIWKMAAVGLLVPFALRRHHKGEFLILAAMLAFYALGDGLLEFDLFAGGLAFAIGHVVAIYLYFRHRRVKPVFSQKLLAVTLLVLPPIIAAMLPDTAEEAVQMGSYGVILSIMAAMAWSSNFPRYRVGTGAVMFVISDLLIAARLGPLAGSEIVDIAIWYLYYFGVFLIATGVAQTLVKRGHYGPSDE